MIVPRLEQYRHVLVNYMFPWRNRVLLLALMLFISIGLQLVNPQILRLFIDTAIDSSSPALPGLYWPAPDTTQTQLLMIALLFMVIAVLQQLVAVGAVFYGEDVGWKATNRLRSDLAAHCLRLDMSFHHQRTPGEMIERVDSDVTQIANFFSQFVIIVIAHVLLLAGVVTMIFRENALVGVVMGIYALFTLWALNRVRSFAIPAWGSAREASASFYGFLEEQLSGTEDTRSSGAVPWTLRNFARLMNFRLKSEQKAGMMNAGIFGVVAFCAVLGTGISLVAGYLLYSQGVITLGTVFLFVSYTHILVRPMRELTMQVQELQKAGAGIGRVNELLAIQTKIEDGAGVPVPLGPLNVEFDNVIFSYNDEEVVLQNVDFRLAPGKVLGLLGRTGSGKTTISRLLFRLYDPVYGSIRLGGTDLRDASLHQLRQRIGIVTQDVQLFRASVRDNLTFFDDSIPDERILEAIHDLGLGPWLAQLPEGLDTRIDSGGRGLSAGEAQLLAFTRVFLKDPGLVILDEASSRLDPVTEHRIERAIDKLLHQRSGIIVAHRLATVQRTDEIMVIDGGKIVEHDSRARLAADPDSRFAQLLRTGLEEALA